MGLRQKNNEELKKNTEEREDKLKTKLNKNRGADIIKDYKLLCNGNFETKSLVFSKDETLSYACATKQNQKQETENCIWLSDPNKKQNTFNLIQNRTKKRNRY